MSKVLIQQSILISKFLTGSIKCTRIRKTLGEFTYKKMNYNGVDRAWGTYDGTMKEPRTLKGRFMATLRPTAIKLTEGAY